MKRTHNNGFQRIAGLVRDFQILSPIKACSINQILCAEIPQPLKPNVMPRHTHLFKVIIAMGLLTWLFGCSKGDRNDTANSRYITDQSFRENLAKQTTMSPQTLAQLRQYNVTDNTTLRLEFFFYTDTEAKAKALAAALRELNYEVETGPSDGNEQLFLVTGWTDPLKMDNRSVVEWTEKMCRLGYEHDCEFDGWGTNPEQ